MRAWKLLSTKSILQSDWLKVRENSYELPDGTVIPTYYITERNDATVCVCYTGERFVLVRQYRPGIEAFTLCHPGGRLETGDSSPLTGALRELLEETGYQPTHVVSLGSFAQIPAVSTGTVHLFLVRCESSPQAVPKPENTEDLRVELMTLVEVVNAINTGQMNCLACVAATYRALPHLGNPG